MTERLAIFPGSFDPLTNGHISVINRGLALFDRVLVAVTVNLHKRPLFSYDERMELIERAFIGEPRISVGRLEGLLAHYARERGASAILRGLRSPSDFEYELQMAQMNRHLNDGCETVFLASTVEDSFVSSSLIKEVARLGGDFDPFVPDHIAEALRSRLGRDRP